MPILSNGKTKNNIIRNLDSFISRVIEDGDGLIYGTSYRGRFTYYNLSDSFVEPDSSGDDMFMVNNHNGIHFSEVEESNLRSALIRYLNGAIASHSGSKATVQIRRNALGRYELDNMRIYDSLSEAKKAGYANRADYVTSLSTDKIYPLPR